MQTATSRASRCGRWLATTAVAQGRVSLRLLAAASRKATGRSRISGNHFTKNSELPGGVYKASPGLFNSQWRLVADFSVHCNCDVQVAGAGERIRDTNSHLRHPTQVFYWTDCFNR